MIKIISVDHGNRMMKTSNNSFMSGYIASDHLPTLDCDVLVYEGNEYILSDKRVIQKNDKTDDDSYFILTLFAIGKELISLDDIQALLTEEPINVELLTGLPPLHYKSFHLKFKEYFLKRKQPIKFALNKQPIAVNIKDVHVFPQAYAAAITAFDDIKDAPIVNIVDIGGYTVDIIQLENLKTNMDVCTTFYKGVNTLFQKINEHIRATGDKDIRESIIENILLNDLKSIENYSKARIELIQNQALKFATDVLLEVGHNGMDLTEDVTVFVGGGSMLLKEYLKKTNIAKKVIFVEDLCANAKGYQIIYYTQRES